MIWISNNDSQPTQAEYCSWAVTLVPCVFFNTCNKLFIKISHIVTIFLQIVDCKQLSVVMPSRAKKVNALSNATIQNCFKYVIYRTRTIVWQSGLLTA